MLDIIKRFLNFVLLKFYYVLDFFISFFKKDKKEIIINNQNNVELHKDGFPIDFKYKFEQEYPSINIFDDMKDSFLKEKTEEVLILPEYESEMFSDNEEENKYFEYIASLIKEHKISPTLAYYTFCSNKDAKGFKIHNDYLNLSNKLGMKLVSELFKYEKLYSYLFADKAKRSFNALSLNKYMAEAMFKGTPNIRSAEYTAYFSHFFE